MKVPLDCVIKEELLNKGNICMCHHMCSYNTEEHIVQSGYKYLGMDIYMNNNFYSFNKMELVS